MVLGVIIGVVLWALLPEKEPVYQGKSLSAWLDGYITSGSIIDVRPDADVDEAVRQIGTNAIPALLRKVRARDSEVKRLAWRLPEWSLPERLPRFLWAAYFTTQSAATAFGALGAAASNAVPTLVQTYRENLSPESQRACVKALGGIGPAASGAVSVVLSAATNSDYRVRAAAVEALGNLQAADSVVSMWTNSLHDSDAIVRRYASRSLAHLGPGAKAAAPALLQLLTDPEPHTRTNAANSLKAVDPEAAAQAGVE